jgi:hypothetical protein
LDGNFAKPHDGVQKYATVTAEEFERQRLGFEKQLAFLNEHPEKNKKVIEKLTASFDALRNTYQQGFDPVLQQTALHQPLLYGFYAICFISILLALAS